MTIIALTLISPVLTLGLYQIYLLYRYQRATTGDKTASGLRLLKTFWIVALQPSQWEEVMRQSELGRSFVDDDLSEQAGFDQDGEIT